MRFFFRYIKDRRRAVICFAICFAVITVCFALYELPLAAVGYTALLCAFVGALFLISDYRRAKKKHNTLCALLSVTDDISDKLIKYDSLDDEDYKNIISAMLENSKAKELDEQKRIEDMEDYYTAWVHQIKTPISSMELLLQQEDSRLAVKLRDELSKTEHYVGMVMTYIRLNSDSSDYVFSLVSLDAVIKNTVKRLSSQFISRRIRLDYTPIDEKTVTDQKWFSFVLEQILSNALKYTPEGSISIYLEKPMTLCIKDTGIGIAPEDIKRIFEKGYTGNIGRVNSRASGLGLYLAKRVCDDLGCDIWALSEVGKGTTVKIDLNKKEVIE